MPVYRIDSILSHNSSLIYLKNYRDVMFKSGVSVIARIGSEPIICTLDEELRLGPMPTFFTSPTWIVRKKFRDFLVENGITEYEEFAACIVDPIDGRENHDYVLINITKAIACANMKASKYHELPPNTLMISELTIKKADQPLSEVFVVKEDPSIIIVSERLQRLIKASEFKDIALREVTVS